MTFVWLDGTEDDFGSSATAYFKPEDYELLREDLTKFRWAVRSTFEKLLWELDKKLREEGIALMLGHGKRALYITEDGEWLFADEEHPHERDIPSTVGVNPETLDDVPF